MGRSRFSGCVVVVLLSAALQGAPAFAGDFEHRLLVANDGKALANELNRAGSSGYRLSALVDRADDLGALVTRAAGNERFEYAVIPGDSTDAVSDLGKRGYAWRASATALGWASPVIVLERPSSGLAAHDLRVVVAGDVAALEGQLGESFAQGFHVVGRQRFEQKKVWVVLERTNGAPAREVRVISADGREKLEGALASAASQGFAFETFWAHPAGVFRRDPLVAIVARPKGSTAPAPHCSIEEESRTLSGSSAHLVALDTVDQGREYLAAWCPGGSGRYSSRDIDLERPQGTLSGAQDLVEYELRSWSVDAIVGAYLLREYEQPAILVAITLDPGMRFSEPEVAKVKALAPPKDGAPLPANGGELLRIYLEMHRLFHAKKLDPAAVKPHFSAKVLAKVAADVKEMGWPFKEKDMLEHQSLAFDGTDPRFRDGWIAADRGLVRIDAVHDGLGSLIEIRYVREGGAWKIDDWGSWDRIAP